MKTVGIGVGFTALYIVLILAIVVGGTVFSLWLNGWALPWEAKIERTPVKQSESFTNSSNLAIQGMIDQYNGLEVEKAKAQAANDDGSVSAYNAQEQSMIAHICMQISTMNIDTVAPSNLAFVQTHGGCH